MIKRFVILLSISLTQIASLQAAYINLASKNLTDNSDNYTINFGTVARDVSSFVLANQYVKIDFEGFTDAARWRMDIYTNNTAPGAGYQVGGLLNTTNSSAVLPLGWKIAGSTSTTLESNPYSFNSGWYWLKDKNDKDIPTTSDNESWDNSRNTTYSMVCYGSPRNSFLKEGKPVASTAYLYLQGDFSAAAAGTYSGSIWFDLYADPDSYMPVISHDPVEKVVGKNNLVVIEAEVNSFDKLQWARLHFKLDSGEWQTSNMSLLSLTTSTYKYTFEPESLKNVKNLYYAIEVFDGWSDAVWFRSLETPHLIEFVDEVSYSSVSEGSFAVPDGNPDDGNTGIVIPPGALSEKVDLTITQLDITKLPGSAFGVSSVSTQSVAAFEFGPHGLQFSKPVAITLLYRDLNNDGIVEFPDGTSTGINENDLRITWWDGFEWRTVGGVVDPVMNTVTVSINHFSIYALFAPNYASAAAYRPKEKFITPMTSGSSDIAYFDGLSGQDYKISIFDINARNVRTITSPELPQWNGKDDSGTVVESGVYIYQFEAVIDGNKKLVSGTIIVAK